MKILKGGFVASFLLALIALLVIGGGAYVYKNTTFHSRSAPAVSSENTPTVRNVAEQASGTTTAPVISSIEVVIGLPTGTVWSGNGAEVYGVNLRDIVSLRIGNLDVVPIKVFVDTGVYTMRNFTVPALSEGTYIVTATNSLGQTSNSYEMKVVNYAPGREW